MLKKLIICTFMFICNICNSQSKKNLLIGEIIYDSNIVIENDTIKEMYLFTNKGYCTAVRTKYKNKRLSNLNEIKNKIKVSESWTVDSNHEDDRYSKYICELTEGDSKLKIFYEGLDQDEIGIVVEEIFVHIMENEAYGYDSRDWIKANSFNDFLILPETIKRRKELSEKAESDSSNEKLKFQKLEDDRILSKSLEIQKNKHDVAIAATPVENIILPYKFKFGMTPLGAEQHLKSILESNSTYTIQKGASLIELERMFGITYALFKVKTDGAFSFSTYISFYKGKAYSYEYQQSTNLKGKLSSKITTLLNTYNKLGTHDGNLIYIKKIHDEIAKLQREYKNRGDSIGKKM